MRIEVVPHRERWVEAVRAFNRRVASQGWGLDPSPVPRWLPPAPGRKVFREAFVAVEGGREVRGGYILKHQEFSFGGRILPAAAAQGPVSEGIADKRYAGVGLLLLRDMVARQPLIFGWGMGGRERPLPRLLRGLHWRMHESPLCLRVLNASNFLRLLPFFRDSKARRLAGRALAASGLGPLAFASLQGLSAAAHTGAAFKARGARAEAERVGTFDGWGDEVWERCAGRYSFAAVRDEAALGTLFPEANERYIRLRVRSAGRVVGWALVVRTQMRNQRQFGDLCVGSIWDCLSAPEDAAPVARAALEFLRLEGADLVISNQSHPAWVAALAAQGFLVLKGRRLFAASRPLGRLLEPFAEKVAGLHLTSADADGPLGLQGSALLGPSIYAAAAAPQA
jgi:hypothetical protein